MASIGELLAAHEAKYGSRQGAPSTGGSAFAPIAELFQQRAAEERALQLLQRKAEIEDQVNAERLAKEQERQFDLYKKFKGMDDRTGSGDVKRVADGGKGTLIQRKATVSPTKIKSKFDITTGKADISIEDKQPTEILQEEISYGFYSTPQEIVRRGMELGADPAKIEALASVASLPGVMTEEQPVADVPEGYRVASYKPNKFGIMEPSSFEPVPEKKPQTEAQAKAALFARRTADAEKVFTNLEDYISSLGFGQKVEETLPNVANFLKSSEMQQYEQAQRNFYNSILRRESGAVISPTEFSEAKKQYFPQAGDKPEVIAQKKRNREVAIEELAKEGSVDIGVSNKSIKVGRFLVEEQ